MHDSVVALVAHCLDRIESGDPQAVELVCAEHPELAADIRTRVDRLIDVGLVASPTRPRAIGPYEVMSELGRGGMGVVYLARDPSLGREVAVKVAPPAVCLDERATLRFMREARAVARLSHPGIVAVFDVGQHAGAPFYVMEHVAGESLAAALLRIRKEGEPLEQLDCRSLWTNADVEDRRSYVASVVDLVADVADALAHAHTHDVVHRDVKSANLLLRTDGRVQVVDFGLTKSGETAGLTVSGAVLGTPAYSPPEQLRGEPVDGRADVWSLGIVLYECLALRLPFPGPTVEQIMRQVFASEPRPLARSTPAVPRDLDAIVAKALEKDPKRRYPSMAELAADLRAFLDYRPVRARPVGRAARAWRRMLRRPGLAAVLGISASLLVGAAVIGATDSLARRQLHRAFIDAQTASFLTTKAGQLFPPVPSRVAAMDAWLDRADEVLARRPELQAMLVSERDAPGASAPLGSEETVVRELLAGLDGLATVREDVALRRAHSASIEILTVTGEDARLAWGAAAEAISASPSYRGLVVRPQLGLLPLGPDPRSGLWEFWHLRSGATPTAATDPDGGAHVVVRAETGIVFVLLPGGDARVGSVGPSPEAPEGSPFVDPSPDLSPRPVQSVPLAPFFLSKYEVTRAQWQRLTGQVPSFWAARDDGTFPDEANPVESVNWDMARSVMAREGFVLPTDTQWEFACRAHTTTVFHTGDRPDSIEGYANVMDGELKRERPQQVGTLAFSDGYAAVAPVGRYRPNGFGLHDMMGNVAEWCADRMPFDEIRRRAGDGLLEDDGHSGRWRIVRGGSWASSVGQCGSGYAWPQVNDSSANWIGVRPARAVER